jgi:hypothetical protein
VSAVQFNVVPVEVVPVAASPIGAAGFAVQLGAGKVVTLSAVLCDDVPAASVAATEKLYVVDAVNPLTEKLVPVAVPIEVPPL